jgi:hypothetical protein
MVTLYPIILPTWQVVIGKFSAQGHPGQIGSRTNKPVYLHTLVVVRMPEAMKKMSVCSISRKK